MIINYDPFLQEALDSDNPILMLAAIEALDAARRQIQQLQANAEFTARVNWELDLNAAYAADYGD